MQITTYFVSKLFELKAFGNDKEILSLNLCNRGFLKSTDLSKLSYKGKVLRSYDPGYMNTITCTSKISYIDGDRGILEYRGYPIEVLA